MFFGVFLMVVLFQRFVELYVAQKNEKWMKERGGKEYGSSHYPWIVFIHMLYFVVLILEVIIFNRDLSHYWPSLFILFLLLQAGRIWALASLGRYWNTKIIILPGANVVKKGPYKLIRHPNYVIVALEIIVMAFMFNAYITAVVFSALNAIMMCIRIPLEEKALKGMTDYRYIFKIKT